MTRGRKGADLSWVNTDGILKRSLPPLRELRMKNYQYVVVTVQSPRTTV
jgi:hypothetical protein